MLSIPVDINDHIKKIPGFRISDTHFKIGAKIHATDFYYAKALFQNSFYTSRIALQLAKNILAKDDIGEEITLVGYEMYSELLLSLVKKFLNETEKLKVNHFIVYDNGKELDQLPEISGSILKTIVVVPIASTGSTAIKIRDYCKKKNFPNPEYFFNVLVVQDIQDSKISVSGKTFKSKYAGEVEQDFLINLPAEWKQPNDCNLCFETNSKPLYETDKSALTPALIFNLPTCRKLEKEDKERFSKIIFKKALQYGPHKRNNEHFLFSINPETLINENKEAVESWLSGTVKEAKNKDGNNLFKDTSQKVLIISPCHHSNTTFINLVNDLIFNSSATVIHYQADTDYILNFKLMNEKLIMGAEKIVFVDDSLKSGTNFFSIYDLIRFTTGYDEDLKDNHIKNRFAAAIFLSNKSTRETNTRVGRAAGRIFAFNNVHLPNALKLHDKKPLEHELLRYKALIGFALHDSIKQIFSTKYNKLKEEKNGGETENRHVAMFKATHAVYKFFGEKNPFSIRKSFKDFVKDLKINEDIEIGKLAHGEIKVAVMKVLSQYPFLLYKPLKDIVFQWHKEWINKFYEEWKKDFSEFEYEDFKELKFLIRRSVFLGNNFIATKEFIGFIIQLYSSGVKNGEREVGKVVDKNAGQITIDDKIEVLYEEIPFNETEQTNIDDFHLFLVSNYLELIFKNPWVSDRLLEVIKKITPENKQAKQFLRMLALEVAAVIENYYDLILKDDETGWKKVYGNNKKIDIEESTENIKNHLIEYDNTQKKEIANKLILEEKKLLKFLWIRHFMLTDENKKDLNLDDKTNHIFRNIKKFFNTEVGAFFIVTDGKGDPHLMFDENGKGNQEIGQYDKEVSKNEAMISSFLKGVETTNKSKEKAEVSENEVNAKKIIIVKGEVNEEEGQAKKTIIEYQRKETQSAGEKNDKQKWVDLYSIKDTEEIKETNILQNYKHILLIRISKDTELEKTEGKKTEDSGAETTQGIIGFYNQEGFDNEIQARQLLMLLRKDLSEFITKHHKNEEFALWRQAELVKKFAYLAGHGRHMLKDIASIRSSDYTKHKYENIVSTMENLQYLFATKLLESSKKENNIKKILKKSFVASLITNAILDEIYSMGKHIYEMDEIENEVKDVEFGAIVIDENIEFLFDEDLLRFICFELFVNAKKNRFHFIKPYSCGHAKNKLNFKVIMDGNKLNIKIINTGPNIDSRVLDKLSRDLPIKENHEISGIKLIKEIIGKLDESENGDKNNFLEIELPDKPICENCKLYEITVSLTLQPMKA